MSLYIRNTVENDSKKMKQYYGNENYIKLFIEERERERERERETEKVREREKEIERERKRERERIDR